MSETWGELGRAVAVAIKAVEKRLVDRIAALEAKLNCLEARPSVRYLGIHTPEADYSIGDLVSRDGSIFHCNRAMTKALPGDGQDWTLAVKRGRDGKDAR